MAEVPRVKRLYQPSISTYFDRAVNDENVTAAPARQTKSPPLPDQIQSSLLNVGMRVRRAVPGGYRKAHASATKAASVTRPLAEVSFSGTPARELQPYCGIHSVGGMMEPQFDLFDPAVDVEEGLCDSSQDSLASTATTDSTPAQMTKSHPHTHLKRAYDEEDQDQGQDQDEEQMLYPDASVRFPAWRAFARPRRLQRRKPSAVVTAPAPTPMDTSEDFEEAPFLVSME